MDFSKLAPCTQFFQCLKKWDSALSECLLGQSVSCFKNETPPTKVLERHNDFYFLFFCTAKADASWLLYIKLMGPEHLFKKEFILLPMWTSILSTDSWSQISLQSIPWWRHTRTVLSQKMHSDHEFDFSYQYVIRCFLTFCIFWHK